MAAPVFVEKKWEYAEGSSSGVVTAAEVRRAPYHSRLSKLSTETEELASLDLRDLHANKWKSKVHLYDVLFQPAHDGPPLQAKDFASCEFSREAGEYNTWSLEEFRGRLIKDIESNHGQLYVVEDLTPPVMEVLGYTLQLNPACFSRHIESAWGFRESSISASDTVPIAWPGPTDNRVDLLIRYPRLVAVSHPSALKDIYPEWREDCLKRAARHAQGRQLFPILDLPKESKVQCVSFDHCTVSVQLDASSPPKWKAIVFFPHSQKTWTDGHLTVNKEDFIRPEKRAAILKRFSALTDDTDVSRWLSALDRFEEDIACGLPVGIFQTLWFQALEYWQLHAHQLGLAVEILSTRSVTSEGNGLEAQRQLRAVIVLGVALTSDIIDDIQRTVELLRLRATARDGVSWRLGPGVTALAEEENADAMLVRLSSLRAQFQQVKARLERHLPTLENLTQFSIVRQQQVLAETQLEESRKAIQQADTIKRLTVLAFIYIPIQTAAALFGMNLQELSQNPPIWVFFVVAIALLVVTVSAAGWHRIVPVLYRIWNNMFGSVRLRTCRVLQKVGINISGLDEYGERLSGWQSTPDPSWIH